jgi:hypothetical protein
MTRTDLVQRLRATAHSMDVTAEYLKFYGGFSGLSVIKSLMSDIESLSVNNPTP